MPHLLFLPISYWSFQFDCSIDCSARPLVLLVLPGDWFRLDSVVLPLDQRNDCKSIVYAEMTKKTCESRSSLLVRGVHAERFLHHSVVRLLLRFVDLQLIASGPKRQRILCCRCRLLFAERRSIVVVRPRVHRIFRETVGRRTLLNERTVEKSLRSVDYFVRCRYFDVRWCSDFR